MVVVPSFLYFTSYSIEDDITCERTRRETKKVFSSDALREHLRGKGDLDEEATIPESTVGWFSRYHIKSAIIKKIKDIFREIGRAHV